MYSKYWLYIPIVGMIIALFYYRLFGVDSFPELTDFQIELTSFIQGGSFGILVWLALLNILL